MFNILCDNATTIDCLYVGFAALAISSNSFDEEDSDEVFFDLAVGRSIFVFVCLLKDFDF